MKKSLLLILILGFGTKNLGAQTPKKYVLLEHFTNSYCGNCASQNPGFYGVYNAQVGVHHLSIHPSVPYQQCSFYQANTVEQNGRATFYGVQGTPVVSTNGGATSGLSSVTAGAISAITSATPKVQITVSETSGANRTATIKVKNLGLVASTNYRLFVALVEKTVNLSTPNGESVHRDVFRKWASSATGDAITVPAINSESSFTINYTVSMGWTAAEIYALAFLQDISTKEVFNSGTRFDITTGTAENDLSAQVSFSPNPSQGVVNVELDQLHASSLKISNISGQVLQTEEYSQLSQFSLNIGTLPSGMYFVQIQTEQGLVSKKIVKN
jgi:hypothetical protein